MNKGAWTLEEQAKEFFYYIGVAITDWAHFEGELFHICSMVLKTNQQNAAIVYFRTPSLDGRLTLVDELIRAVPEIGIRKTTLESETLLKSWDRLIKDIRNELPIRNQLAHSPSTPMTERPDPSKKHELDHWWASYVSGAEMLRGRKKERGDLKIADVQNHLKKLTMLFIRLRNFRVDISGLLR